LSHGSYTLELEDEELFSMYQRHARAIFYFPSPTTLDQQVNVTLLGASSVPITLQPYAPPDDVNDLSNSEGGDEWYQSVSFIISIVCFVLTVGVLLLW
jgi:hypothetical protein